MIVVSNTSPLTNLAAIRQFDLLHKLYGTLHVASGVRAELSFGGKNWPGYDETMNAAWIQHHRISNEDLVTALRRDLDRGEAESIALAVELQADLLLMDEQEGRRFADRFDLNTLGVVGVLIEAKARGEIDLIRPHLDALRQVAGFYLGDAVYSFALETARET